MNTHRACRLNPDGTRKLLASGGFEFCRGKADEYAQKNPGALVDVVPFAKYGYPPEWDTKQEQSQ